MISNMKTNTVTLVISNTTYATIKLKDSFLQNQDLKIA